MTTTNNPTTTSYLADFDPAVYLFMNDAQIKYSNAKTPYTQLTDIAEQLTSLQDGGPYWREQMACLVPDVHNPASFAPAKQCVPSWTNLGTPNRAEINSDTASLETIMLTAIPEDVMTDKLGEAINEHAEALYNAIYKDPKSLQNLQTTLYRVCVNGVQLETDVDTDFVTADSTKQTKSLLELLAKSIVDEALPVLSYENEDGVQYLAPSTQTDGEHLLSLLQRGLSYYHKERSVFNNILQDIINANQALDTKVATNHKTVTALQQKIDLAYKVLHAEGNKLRDLTQNYANSRAQTDQSQRNRVAIGIPYLNPFFTMSQRNYVIMMLCFIVMLVVGILVYAFIGRTRLHGDVLDGRSN